MRRIASAVLAAFGLIAVLTGVGLMTIWAPGSSVSASASAPEAAFIETDPGVIDLVSPEVTITAQGDADADITLAFGHSDDVAAWSEGLNVATVTGLKDWEKLAVATVSDGSTTPPAAPTEDATPVPAASTEGTEEKQEIDPNIASLADSDMWIQVEKAKGKVSVSYRVADTGAISLIAASSDGKAPELTLQWDRPVSNSYAMPIIVIGGLVALIGVLLFVLDLQERKRDAGRKAARDRRVDRKATRAAAETAVLSKISEGSVSGETVAFESGEALAGRAEENTLTGHAFGAGILPSSLDSEKFRARELSDEDRIVLEGHGEDAAVGEAEDQPSAVDPGESHTPMNEAAVWEAITAQTTGPAATESIDDADGAEEPDADPDAGDVDSDADAAVDPAGNESATVPQPDREEADAPESAAPPQDEDSEQVPQENEEVGIADDSVKDKTDDEENTHA